MYIYSIPIIMQLIDAVLGEGNQSDSNEISLNKRWLI